MAARLRPHLRRATVRVALAATGIVAVLYAVIAVAVVVIVTHNLTGDIDRRLALSLTRLSDRAFLPVRCLEVPAGVAPRFGAPILIWTVFPDGRTCSAGGEALPRPATSITGAETLSLGGTDVRVAGKGVGGGYVVAGESLTSVGQTRSTLILTELVIAPVLLGVVFLGALAIGRRAAAPIELARRRQMEFTADASHELRTPLSVIEAQTSLALAQERDVGWYRRGFERVGVESARIRRLVEDLLWLARFDSTAPAPHAEPVDVAILARQAVDRFTAVAETRRLRLSLRTDATAPVVTAPPEWVDRLLGVLLDNACRYTPEGGSVEVAVADAGGRVRLAVDDSGPGIPPEERSRIFDRFHRASDRPGGAGLGLAIANAVVGATRGRWEIGTSAAGGASMAVSWPRGLGGARPAPAVPPAVRATE